MTPETKKQLLHQLIGAINFKTVMTTLFTGVMCWMGGMMITGFRDVQKQIKEDHTNITNVIPAVRQLQRTDSTKTLQITKQNLDGELIKASQDEVKKDIEELKSLIYQVLRQTR